MLKDYILFVDTETSGLPKDWNSSNLEHWPYIIQIAWILYTRDGEMLKAENHFIYDEHIKIDPKSQKIHGITAEMLLEKGEKRIKVLKKIHHDIKFYRPLVVGHWISFDVKMLSIGFRRAGLPNVLQDVPLYCTMLSNSHYMRFSTNNYPKLGELYNKLFDEKLDGQHDALVDVKATAACFFELVKRNEITEDRIRNYQEELVEKTSEKKKVGCGLPALLFLLTIFYLLI